MTDTPRLSLKNITHEYAGQRVVDDVSLDVMPGQVVCLLGPSGCGKSTTLKIAAGVERQTSGTVCVDGIDVSGTHVHEPPEARAIGLMFQDFALFPHLTVAQNIAFGLKGGHKPHSKAIEQWLDRVSLPGYGAKYPHQLSGGEQQRVALARAMAPNPRVILMDEPFSGLDNRLRDAVRDEAMSLLTAEGSSTLLVTHEPEEAMRVADLIVLMRDGKVVQSGAPYNIYNRPEDRLVAGFFSDINVIHGLVNDAQIDTPFGMFLAPGQTNGTKVEIVIRPQHLKLDFDRQGKGPLPTQTDGVPARGCVRRVRFVGNESHVELCMDHDSSILRVTVPAVFMPQKDTALWVSMRRDRCHVFPAR